ncbi:hypothetical protein PAPYR_8071 [Paratrimastix pyriformis]|uniref:WW domain-containing protein n=1 Tax=Paratrimastix pyriformis TaxID=342808 RepID=A0ABQ8UD06_9EUKA|nr:hypothetical protein PAPYR_8071 [Paratrimastix pyriformis]
MDEEVLNYASFLGFQLPEDGDLLWIAEAGYRAPLPDGWTENPGLDGLPFYHNAITMESSWEHPADAQFRHLFRNEKQKQKSRVTLPDRGDLACRDDYPTITQQSSSPTGEPMLIHFPVDDGTQLSSQEEGDLAQKFSLGKEQVCATKVNEECQHQQALSKEAKNRMERLPALLAARESIQDHSDCVFSFAAHHKTDTVMPDSGGDGMPSSSSWGLTHFPTEILLKIVHSAHFTLRTYCQLIALDHTIRSKLRGTDRILSLTPPEDLAVPPLPSDAFAALMGPFHDLERLEGAIVPAACSREESTWSRLVDEAFVGKIHLRNIDCSSPGLPAEAVARALGHLPALEEVTLCLPAHGSLAVLAVHCPHLRKLTLIRGTCPDPLDFSLVQRCSGLVELRLEGVGLAGLDMRSLRAALPHLTRLEATPADPQDPDPVFTEPAPPLTSLYITPDRLAEEFDWSEAAAGHLEHISVEPSLLGFPLEPLASLARLRSLSCRIEEWAALPTGLLDRLVRLEVVCGDRRPLALRSASLQDLDLVAECPLALDCPALRTLSLPPTPGPISLRCPALTRLLHVPEGAPLLFPDGPLYTVTTVSFRAGAACAVGSSWGLALGALAFLPRVRVLEGVRLGSLAELGALCAALGRLVELRGVAIAACPADPSRPTAPLLRTGARLRVLDLAMSAQPLAIEGPRLESLSLAWTPAAAPAAPGAAASVETQAGLFLSLGCPHLHTLRLAGVSLAPDQLTPSALFASSAAPPLRHLAVHPAAWPAIAGLLPCLPRLQSLEICLGGGPVPVPASIAFPADCLPALRALTLADPAARLAALRLGCWPALERVDLSMAVGLREVTMSGEASPGPYLRHVRLNRRLHALGAWMAAPGIQVEYLCEVPPVAQGGDGDDGAGDEVGGVDGTERQ